MKKFFLLGVIFLSCGCGTDKVVEDFSSTRYSLAKNKVSLYAGAVRVAYTDYKYKSLVGEFVAPSDGTVVNIDGVDVSLNIDFYGDDVKCSSISIVNDNVMLDDCSIFEYTFMYDGEAIQK